MWGVYIDPLEKTKRMDPPAPATNRTDTPATSPAHGATVAHIFDRLRNDILARRLPPGARLVESDLTTRFAVSRGPVREALRRLRWRGAPVSDVPLATTFESQAPRRSKPCRENRATQRGGSA